MTTGPLAGAAPQLDVVAGVQLDTRGGNRAMRTAQARAVDQYADRGPPRR